MLLENKLINKFNISVKNSYNELYSKRIFSGGVKSFFNPKKKLLLKHYCWILTTSNIWNSTIFKWLLFPVKILPKYFAKSKLEILPHAITQLSNKLQYILQSFRVIFVEKVFGKTSSSSKQKNCNNLLFLQKLQAFSFT